MRFKFCGNIDSPEWLISEVIFLTKISAIRLRMLCNNVANFIINNGKNYKEIQKALDDMNFSESEGKTIFSLLDFIIRSSIKFDVAENILSNELQQLGLPQENADAITKIFKNQKENLRNKLKEDVFSFSRIKNVNYKISYVLANDIMDFKSNCLFESLKDDENKDLKSVMNSDNLLLNNVECKVNFNIEDNTGFNTTTGFNFTSNKDVLGKLINDLSKAAEMIKKFQES